ncbi:hypothetical protein MTO96_031702, partial [Rhipicephalus appendiculatus]
ICNRTGYDYFANLARDNDYLYSFSYDKEKGRKLTLVFDDLQSMNEKMCHIIYNSTLVNYTFVAYDVNDDYSASACPKAHLGPFLRLYKINQLNHFLLTDFKNKPFKSCNNI